MEVPQPVQNIVDKLMANDITLLRPSGEPMVRLRLLHGAALIAAGVLVAPRFTALAATGAMLKGIGLRIESPEVEIPLG